MRPPTALKPLPAGDSTRPPERGRAGFTLLELLITLAIAAVLFLALGGVVGEALMSWSHSRERNELLYQGKFALQRMTTAVQGTRRLMIPLGENPGTAWSESLRNPGVLAVTLDPTLDRDGDGFADADNDKDGLVDEDVGADNTCDGQPGIVGIDDNGDGSMDTGNVADNDEDGFTGEDPIDGLDNDGDGAFDEDPDGDMNGDAAPGVAGADDDGDGQVDEGQNQDDDEDGIFSEDWFDPVVYFLSGSSLMERLPNPNPTNGNDYTERLIAENVTLFRVERIPQGGSRAVLVDIALELTGPAGETVSLKSRMRVGGGP